MNTSSTVCTSSIRTVYNVQFMAIDDKYQSAGQTKQALKAQPKWQNGKTERKTFWALEHGKKRGGKGVGGTA